MVPWRANGVLVVANTSRKVTHVPDHGRNRRADSSYPVTANRAGPAPNRAGPAPVFPPVEQRGSRLVAVLGAVTAAVVTAAVLLVTMSALRAPTGPAEPVQGAPPTIAGPKVFRPDVIGSVIEENNAAITDSSQPGWRPDGGMDGAGGSESSGPDDPDESAAEGTDTPTDGTQPSTTGATESASGSTAAAASADGEKLCATLQVTDPTLCRLLGPVQEFYALVTTDPERAFAMLDSSLQGGDAQTFAQAWSQVEAATVDSAELVDRNTVQVQVTYLRTDDRKMITVQRLELRGGTRPHILRAQLLSAVFG